MMQVRSIYEAGFGYGESIFCADGSIIQANRLELSVWSDHFYQLFTSHQEAEFQISNADSEDLETLVRALYEKEVGLWTCQHTFAKGSTPCMA